MTSRAFARAVFERALRGAATVALPAVLAGLAAHGLVPRPGSGATGVLGLVARAGQAWPLPGAVVLFFVFSAIVRYWMGRFSGVRRRPPRSGPAVSRTRAALLSGGPGIALAAIAAILLRARVVESFVVLSASMLPTLEPGDRVVGSRMAYDLGGHASARHPPARGDIIVFRSAAVPIGAANVPAFLVKRVIGLPGDRVAFRGGRPIVNGWAVPSCDAGEYGYLLPGGEGRGIQGRVRVEFLDATAYLTVTDESGANFPAGGEASFEVAAGEVFVLGDNRGNSVDSRAWNGGRGGGVPVGAVEARVRRLLVGSGRDGAADFGRALRPLDALAAQAEGRRLDVHVDGLDLGALREGIDRCVKVAPALTRPPPPGTGGAAASLE